MDISENLALIEDCAIDTVIEALKEMDIGIFCGAGVSINSGIPSAVDIVRKILVELLNCDEEGVAHLINNKTLSAPFESIIGILKENIVCEGNKIFITEFSKLFEAEPNHNHILLARLLKEKRVRFIATTNFDTCIEDALKDYNPEVFIPYASAVNNYEEREKVVDNNDINGKLIKLHGCRTDPETLGTTSKQIFENKNKLKPILEKIFNTKVLLFIGYSCSDYLDIVEYFITHKSNFSSKYLYWQHGVSRNDIEINAINMFGEYKNILYLVGNTDDLVKIIDEENYHYRSIKNDFYLNFSAINKYGALSKLFSYFGNYELANRYSFFEFVLLKYEYGEASSVVAAAHLKYANSCNNMGNWEEAIEHLELAENILINKVDQKHKLLLGEVYCEYGEAFRLSRKLDRAEKSYLNAADIFSEFEGRSIGLARVYNNLGAILSRRGDLVEAHAFFIIASKMALNLVGDSSPIMAEFNSNLGHSYIKIGKAGEAIELLEKALSMTIATLGEQHPDVAIIYNTLGDAYHYENDDHKSISFYKKAIAILESGGKTSISALLPNINLGNCLYNVGDLEDSVHYINKALAINVNEYGEQHPRTYAIRALLNKVYKNLIQN